MIDRVILILGAMKSGTTALYNYLAQHPDIAASADKEPMYFSSDERFDRGRSWYESLFPAADHARWVLDGSTDCSKYPYCGDVPARIRAFGGEFRLIYIMRHPLRRIESQARHAQMFGSEVNEQPVQARRRGLDGGISEVAVQLSDYAAQIDRFRTWYDQGELLLLTSDQLRHDPKAAVDRVCDFVGLNPIAELKELDYANRREDWTEPRPFSTRLARHPRAVAALRGLLPPSVLRLARRSVRLPGRFRLSPAEETMLLQRLLPSLVRLRDSYGIDAEEHWGITLPQVARSAQDSEPGSYDVPRQP